jgi:hypothetical protein
MINLFNIFINTSRITCAMPNSALGGVDGWSTEPMPVKLELDSPSYHVCGDITKQYIMTWNEKW